MSSSCLVGHGLVDSRLNCAVVFLGLLAGTSVPSCTLADPQKPTLSPALTLACLLLWGQDSVHSLFPGRAGGGCKLGVAWGGGWMDTHEGLRQLGSQLPQRSAGLRSRGGAAGGAAPTAGHSVLGEGEPQGRQALGAPDSSHPLGNSESGRWAHITTFHSSGSWCIERPVGRPGAPS